MLARLMPPTRIPWYSAVLALRSLGVVLAVSLLQALEPLGTSPIWIALSGILGVVITSRLAHTRLTSFGLLVFMAAIAAASSTLFSLLHLTLSGITPNYFLTTRVQLHVNTCLLAAGLTSLSTWVFWRVRGAITFEAITLTAIAILVFAGHRDFHFDRPKIINSLAWRIGISHLSMLIVVGSTLLVVGLCYLYLGSQAVRPRAEGSLTQVAPGERRWGLALIILAALMGVLYGVQSLLFNHYTATTLARLTNGVGMGENLGVSPLSFQSALGSTNQPAGLIRLEGDYSDNPFSPMLYMRESALSQFNGKEMVFAGRAFDTDLPVVSPRDTFTGKEDPDIGPRTPLIQSMYLLADHDSAFAVDYPLSIVQLKNPNPARFKSSYRAYSSAPAFQMSAINTMDVGDPRWTEDVKRHYLQAHPDPRYRERALEITQGASSPVEQVLAITEYLNKTAIYTLTPNHTTQPGEDPVVPFLFGDHRGYCVHFAHAITYMARSLGIPARVGTGYLTDLSQAKDGHILLRMSDRHAWAEVYLTGVGWVPFDVQPEQVESHADTQVDSKLLEELMGSLEPGEEILPPDATKDEPGMKDPTPPWVPDSKTVLSSLILILGFFVVTKVILRVAWRFTHNPQRKARWGYISVASRLYDSGVVRRFGETREEFSARIGNGLLLPLATILNHANYAQRPELALATITQEVKNAHSRLDQQPLPKRTLVVLNPASVTHLLGGGTW